MSSKVQSRFNVTQTRRVRLRLERTATKRERAAAVVAKVWLNSPPKRYLPRSFSAAGPGWGVWDAKANKFIEADKDVGKIDPDELLVN